MTQGPLEGLRVVDLTDDSGRFATKLLCEQGASVVRLRHGSRGRSMAASEADQRGGLLDWWYDSGKPLLDIDLRTEEGRESYREVAERADLIIETEPPGALADLGVDYADLSPANPRLVQVSLTPFGRTGPRSGWHTSDLVASALGGILSLSGLPDQPQTLWGRQAFNIGGFVAAVSGMAAVWAARRDGLGQHVDVALHEAVCTTVEQLFFQFWFDDLLPYPKIAQRQGSLHWIHAYKVVPAASGWEMITPSPRAAALMGWMLEEQFPPALELAALPPEDLIANMGRIMETIAAFARTMDAGTLFVEAQRRHIAFGEVQTVAQVGANPQHAFRGFFRPAAWEGPRVLLPGPLARFHGSPAPSLPPPGDSTDLGRVLEEWAAPKDARGEDTAGKPLSGLRVLDLSHVLAGPMCTRMLGDLGADIVKVQTLDRAVVVNDPGHPFFYTWNRSKRVVTLNMRHERAAEIARGLIEQSDVLIENFSSGVLDRWGLGYPAASEWNPRLVYVTMSGCGHDGPWSDMVSFAPTIHALSGLTHLSNPADRGDVGPGFSINDHAVGMTAALAILSALHRREIEGVGQLVDISQLETGGYLIGPALVDYLSNGREAKPVGNRDPDGDIVPNECYPTADGAWLAVSCRDDAEWDRLVAATGIPAGPEFRTLSGRRDRIREVDELVAAWAAGVDAEGGQALLQGSGVPAGRIQNAADLMTDPQLIARDMWRSFDHPTFGTRSYDRYPALFSRSVLEPYLRPAAYPGEGNFEVYPELLDLDETAVADAMESGLFS
jgi:crotonobetainyl-CoA:carnitine CoA-transferase CaiB-like acyl-CoA transferase